MTGPDLPALALKALPLVIKAIRKLSEPATQDKLVAAIKAYSQVPKLTRCQRRRLMKVIGTEDAANALMDQDPAATEVLSKMIADAVFKEQVSDRSRAIADALITEYPGCVDGAENAILVAYQLRLVRRTLSSHGDQLEDISHTVAAVHAIVATPEPGKIDPEVILNGPLDGLKLQDDYQRVLECQDSDPADAARRSPLVRHHRENRTSRAHATGAPLS